jgi:sulfur carrier protein ThiS
MDIQIHIKLLANYQNYLPPESERNEFSISVSEETTPESILNLFSIPPIPESVVLINGKTSQPKEKLHEGDEICIFSAMAGG